MLSYSTKSIPPQARLSYWNDVLSDVFMPQETQPKDEQFEGEITTVSLGRLMMTSVSTTASRVVHSKQQAARTRQRRFNLCLQLQGSMAVDRGQEQIVLREGDLVLADSYRPYSLQYDQPCTTVGLVMSDEDLKQHLPNPDEVAGAHLTGDSGLAHAASVMLRSLWMQAQNEIEPEIGARVADSFLQLFAATWLARRGVQPPDSVVVGYRRTQIKRYIEAQLRDPGLSVSSVAGAFGISARYLHILFANEGETISNYVLRRRLDQCVKQLSNPLWSKRTITEIAFSWGFNNATHFARVFRQRYDMTPRDYRNQLFAGEKQRPPIPA
jgi:AraC-like DNA-binding protein